MVKDITNKTFGRLRVINRAENDKWGSARWICKCKCGKICIVLGASLRSGKTSSCGCLHRDMSSERGTLNRKVNTYDLSGSFGIGYTNKLEQFYFDLEDYEKIKEYCWYIDTNGYVVSKRDKMIYMHRLVMNCPKNKEVDHKHHVKNDNRKNNLRVCTSSQNKFNKPAQCNSKSGVRGVYFHKDYKKWIAELIINGVKLYLGSFDEIDDAVDARLKAEKDYHKEFRFST